MIWQRFLEVGWQSFNPQDLAKVKISLPYPQKLMHKAFFRHFNKLWGKIWHKNNFSSRNCLEWLKNGFKTIFRGHVLSFRPTVNPTIQKLITPALKTCCKINFPSFPTTSRQNYGRKTTFGSLNHLEWRKNGFGSIFGRWRPIVQSVDSCRGWNFVTPAHKFRYKIFFSSFPTILDENLAFSRLFEHLLEENFQETWKISPPKHSPAPLSSLLFRIFPPSNSFTYSITHEFLQLLKIFALLYMKKRTSGRRRSKKKS